MVAAGFRPQAEPCEEAAQPDWLEAARQAFAVIYFIESKGDFRMTSQQASAVTESMIEAGYEVFGPFNRDVWEQTAPGRMREMLRAVYTAMRSVEAGADVKSGIRAGLALYQSQASR